jgi:hypothetical protein
MHIIFGGKIRREEKYLETQRYMEDNIELHLYDMRTWTCLILHRVTSSIAFHIIWGMSSLRRQTLAVSIEP